MTTLWTISYQGRSADEIAERLKENGITRMVHIGTTAAELEGSSLEAELQDRLSTEGIELMHLDSVEEPPQFRGIAADRGREELTAAFQAYLSKRTGERDRFNALIEERPTAVLCYLPGEQACQGVLLVQMHQARGGRVERL